MKIKKFLSLSDGELAESRTGKFLYPDGRCNRRGLILTLISVILAIASMSAVIYYILGPMEGYLHSDYTDSIYWANATLESGKVFDPDFVYAGLLPFSANLWLMPLILMFGVSMTAQKIGMIIYMLLLVAAIYFMCRGFKWSISLTATAVSAMLLLLSGSDKLREMMWGHVIYYSLALLLLFTGIGVAARISEIKTNPSVKQWVLCILGALLFVGTVTNGLQLIALVTLPCMGVLFVEMFFDPARKLMHKDNVPNIVILLSVVGCTAVGMLLLKLMQGDIVARYAGAYTYIVPAENWMNNFLDLPRKWFTLFGVEYAEKMKMLEVESIKMIIMTAVGLLIAVIPVVGLCNYRKITDKGVRAILVAHFAVSAVIIFGYVCGTLGDRNWRLLPMMGTAIMASLATAKHFISLDVRISLVPRRLAALILAVLICGSCINLISMANMPADHGRKNDQHLLLAELESRDLEYGYASFWYSQAITILSDSRVKTRMVIADKDEGVTTDYYQNSFRWYEDQEGVDRYFVLLSIYENSVAEKCDDWLDFVDNHAIDKTYLLDKFVLYVFDCNLDFPDPEIFK